MQVWFGIHRGAWDNAYLHPPPPGMRAKENLSWRRDNLRETLGTRNVFKYGPIPVFGYPTKQLVVSTVENDFVLRVALHNCFINIAMYRKVLLK